MRLRHWPSCLTLAIHSLSFAQTTAIQTSDPSRGATLPPTSAALADEATAPAVNPAGLAYLNNICSNVSCWPRFQLFYIHDQSWAPGNLNRTADALHLGL